MTEPIIDKKSLFNFFNAVISEFQAARSELQELRVRVSRDASYLARREMQEIIAKSKDNPFRLEPYGFKVYSQADEDGIIKEIFKRLNIEKGSFCEIGVENGLECNTLFLLHQGWKGCWLEGAEKQINPIRTKFRRLFEFRRLNLLSTMISPENINQKLREGLQFLDLIAEDLDFLSIDVDGMDIYLLDALTLRPKVICIEYNAKFPPPVVVKPLYNPDVRWQGTDYMGSSICALVESANRLGYVLISTSISGANAFFVRKDLLKLIFPEVPSVETLYSPARYYLVHDHFRFQVGHTADYGDYEMFEELPDKVQESQGWLPQAQGSWTTQD